MKVQFTVSPDNAAEFSDILAENDLRNSIAGSTTEGDLLINVHFTSENRDTLDSLVDLSVSEEEDD